MKKIISLLLLISIGIVFTGCGSKIKEEEKKVEQFKERSPEVRSTEEKAKLPGFNF